MERLKDDLDSAKEKLMFNKWDVTKWLLMMVGIGLLGDLKLGNPANLSPETVGIGLLLLSSGIFLSGDFADIKREASVPYFPDEKE